MCLQRQGGHLEHILEIISTSDHLTYRLELCGMILHKLKLMCTKYEVNCCTHVEVISIFVGGIFLGSPCITNVVRGSTTHSYVPANSLNWTPMHMHRSANRTSATLSHRMSPKSPKMRHFPKFLLFLCNKVNRVQLYKYYKFIQDHPVKETIPLFQTAEGVFNSRNCLKVAYTTRTRRELNIF